MRLLGYLRERWKKILKVTLLVIVALYVLANLGIFYFIGNIPGKELIDKTPVKVALPYLEPASIRLPLMEFRLDFPFEMKETKFIWYVFSDHRISDILLRTKLHGVPCAISFTEHAGFIPGNRYSFSELLFGQFLGFEQEDNYFDLMLNSYYATTDDFSWWNLPVNMELFRHLVLKSIAVSPYGALDSFVFESPYVRGLLTIGMRPMTSGMEEAKYNASVMFKGKEGAYSISFMGIEEKELEMIKGVVSNLRLLDNKKEAASEFRSLSRKGSNPSVPEKLALLASLSLDGLSVEGLEHLMKMEKGDDADKVYIDQIQVEIDYLKQQADNM